MVSFLVPKLSSTYNKPSDFEAYVKHQNNDLPASPRQRNVVEQQCSQYRETKCHRMDRLDLHSFYGKHSPARSLAPPQQQQWWCLAQVEERVSKVHRFNLLLLRVEDPPAPDVALLLHINSEYCVPWSACLHYVVCLYRTKTTSAYCRHFYDHIE